MDYKFGHSETSKTTISLNLVAQNNSWSKHTTAFSVYMTSLPDVHTQKQRSSVKINNLNKALLIIS